MRNTFKLLDIFKANIKELVDKEKYEKNDLLNERFLITNRDEIAIYYSSHNEMINEKAEILIVGICPGWRQMERSIRLTKKLLSVSISDDEISRRVKLKTRLFGTTRNNLINMLSSLELHKMLGISSADKLFDDEYKYLHTTSLIRYPVFISGKNYNGNVPSLLKNDFLFNIASKSIKNEINSLSKVKLILPLGKAVEKFLCNIYAKDKNIYEKIIKGFPHPSGLNGHRIRFFKENFSDLRLQFLAKFEESNH
ncbi:hypothetical protein R9X47_11550 [Wukongibacter baidiensis]|uniref:hypothetical protein n=1 Tax=Wukongibacter baidiensis TaxID=1723361 RepID=UPI003D7FE961